MNRISTIYVVLTIIGALFGVYSIKLKNYTLLVVAILFTFVSAYNIFCGLGKRNGKHP